MTNRILCIYHHGCADGFSGAWVVRKAARENTAIETMNGAGVTLCHELADFHPGVYGEAPPDVTDRDVILVDFSYKRPELLRMAEQARFILILDHHVTAQDELVDLPDNVRAVFDSAKCGAMIAWQFFFGDRPEPMLLHHIQDRDLWQWRLPLTREIIAALYSYPMDFDTWDRIMRKPLLDLEREGRAISRQQEQHIAALAENLTRWVYFGDVPVPAANVPWFYASEVCKRLAQGNPFAAAYQDDEHGRKWSLRSAADGADVSVIAAALGGGGHHHAAGFRMTRHEVAAFEAKGGRL